MSYVNRYMKQKEIPVTLRNKIHRFLEYNWEMRKQIKVDEAEVMSQLNKELKNKIHIYIHGKMLYSVDVL
jgi:hypothetical protein